MCMSCIRCGSSRVSLFFQIFRCSLQDLCQARLLSLYIASPPLKDFYGDAFVHSFAYLRCSPFPVPFLHVRSIPPFLHPPGASILRASALFDRFLRTSDTQLRFLRRLAAPPASLANTPLRIQIFFLIAPATLASGIERHASLTSSQSPLRI